MYGFFVMGAMQDGDAYVVNVQSEEWAGSEGYHGTNVSFYRDGRVEADCYGSAYEWMWRAEQIIETARSGQCGGELEKFLKGEPCGDLV